MFIFFFCRDHSSTVLTIMSVEKFFALYFPLKTWYICTVKTAKWVTSISALIFLAFNCQIFFLTDVRPYYHYSYCSWVKVPTNYIKILTHIDGIVYSFGPFVTMLIMNSAIIYKYLKAKWENRHSTTESTNQALSKSAMKRTAMLITVSVMFLCLTAPAALSYAMTLVPDPVIYSVIVLLIYSNHSINGVLYCIVGTRFRQELVNAICCQRKTAANRRFTNHSRSTLNSVINSDKRSYQPDKESSVNTYI